MEHALIFLGDYASCMGGWETGGEFVTAIVFDFNRLQFVVFPLSVLSSIGTSLPKPDYLLR